MATPADFQEYGKQFKGWKHSALLLSPNGQFRGYHSKFLHWLKKAEEDMVSSPTTPGARFEIKEARRRIDALNDDLFPDICEHLSRAFVLAEEINHQIPDDVLKAFRRISADQGVSVEEMNAEVIMQTVRLNPYHQP